MKIGSVIGLLLTGAVVAGGVVGVNYYNDQKTVVTAIVDGDTIDVEQGGESTRIRLLNIDTPEIGREGEASECLAQDARDYLVGLIPVGTAVKLEYDQERQDKYGRTLAGVFKGDVFVNAAIASAGFGVPIRIAPNNRFFNEVSTAAEDARSSSKGIFGVGPECFVNDDEAAKEFDDAKRTIDSSKATAVATQAELDRVKKEHGKVLAAIAVLKKLKNKKFDKTEFQQAAYGDQFEKQIDELLSSAEEKDSDYKKVIEWGEAQLEQERKEEEERKAEEARKEAERLERERQASERERQRAEEQARRANQQQATPPASNGGGAGPGPDTYTGCRAYGGNYAMTSIDNKGRPYAKIDCTTKVQIG